MHVRLHETVRFERILGFDISWEHIKGMMCDAVRF